jgi:protein SCO1/2
MEEPTTTQSMPRWLIPAVVAAVVLLFGSYIAMQALTPPRAAQSAGAPGGSVYEPPSEGTAIDPPRELTDFELTSRDGTPMSLSDLRGKPVLLYFGYTFCPDICPTSLADMVRVKRDLGEQADEIAFVFVSVDGQRDTPERVDAYLENFDADFIGLTGEPNTLRQIGPEFGLYFEQRQVAGTSASYLIDHSTAIYLIDAEGKLQMIYGYGMPPDVMTADIQAMLEQSGS